ncbi:MAG: ElyC/SanA/YdcF family protein [Armatimonas sp.]
MSRVLLPKKRRVSSVVKVRRGFLWSLGGAVGLCLLSLVVSEAAVRSTAAGRCYDSVAVVPQRSVGLVLGTSKYIGRGKVNRYYSARIEAAAALWKAGKVHKLIVSGDNRRHDYNEPKIMRADLVAAGVPKEDIVCDYAGLRTLDSVARAKRIFGQDKVTIISQRFHNERAIFLAKGWGLDAIALDAESPALSPRLKARETLARMQAVWDRAAHTQPRHLGEKITL